MGEGCYAPAGSSAWDKAVSPGPPPGRGESSQIGHHPIQDPCRSHKGKAPQKGPGVVLFAALMDDCAQLCQDWQQHHWIPSDRQRQRPGKLSLGEVLFNGGALPSLPRQGPQAFLPLWGGAGGPPPFAELSRHQQVCGPARAGPTGASPMGGFFGFKLHLPINHRGQIMAFKITGGNGGCPPTVGAHDGALRGKLVGSRRWYIAKPLMQRLWQQGLNLLTGCCTMKNLLLSLLDKRLPRKRSSIETLFATLRSEMGLEHSRHCSPINGFVHLLSCRAAYSLWPQPGSTLAQSPSLVALDLIRNWGFSRHHCPWGRAPPPRCARESPDPTGGIVAKCTANPGQLAGHR